MDDKWRRRLVGSARRQPRDLDQPRQRWTIRAVFIGNLVLAGVVLAIGNNEAWIALVPASQIVLQVSRLSRKEMRRVLGFRR